MLQRKVIVQGSNPRFLQQRATQTDFHWSRVLQPTALSPRPELSAICQAALRETFGLVFWRDVNWFHFWYGVRPPHL
jgi:hypothetical protein